MFTIGTILSLPKNVGLLLSLRYFANTPQLAVVYLGVALAKTDTEGSTKAVEYTVIAISFIFSGLAAYYIYWYMNKSRLVVWRLHRWARPWFLSCPVAETRHEARISRKRAWRWMNFRRIRQGSMRLMGSLFMQSMKETTILRVRYCMIRRKWDAQRRVLVGESSFPSAWARLTRRRPETLYVAETYDYTPSHSTTQLPLQPYTSRPQEHDLGSLRLYPYEDATPRQEQNRFPEPMPAQVTREPSAASTIYHAYSTPHQNPMQGYLDPPVVAFPVPQPSGMPVPQPSGMGLQPGEQRVQLVDPGYSRI
jgi:hypothetical protein